MHFGLLVHHIKDQLGSWISNRQLVVVALVR